MIGDAVQQEQFTIGGAALAGLFLCVCFVVVVGFGGLAILRWVCRYRQTDERMQQLLDTPLPGPAPVTAVLDVEPGIDLALRDECFRILSVPNPYDDPDAVDRLLAEILDEPTGEARDA